MDNESSPKSPAEVEVVTIEDDAPSPSGEERKAPRVNLAHGFVRSIQKNQAMRESCDRDEEAVKMAIRLGRNLKKQTASGVTRSKRPERQLYTPKKRGAPGVSSTPKASTPQKDEVDASVSSPSSPATSPVLFKMEVELSPGKWKTIPVHDTDTAQAVAQQIAQDHDLEPRIAAALAYHIAVNIEQRH